MRLNVQYIPMNKIKPNISIKINEHVKKLRNIMWDCMHILVVKKDKDGSFTIISGNDRFEYLQKHTKTKYAPCIIDESRFTAELKYWYYRVFNPKNSEKNNKHESWYLNPKSVSILRSFLKEEPRFKRLSHIQKTKILILAMRYKKTVISSMKLKVDECLSKKNE
ncbi:hypothetical protein ACFQ4X_01495 [Fictibacillus halophilus]|uniref:hypothetical protein n=1 Tax=Fictibacillus halophilus TaxID=1610490 RepID=UPI00363B2D89